MTNNTGVYELLGTIKLDDKFYEMARVSDQNVPPAELNTKEEFGEKPPYADGAPAMLSEQNYTWHLGGLKSRQGIPGTSEYGQNTDARWAFKLLPSAKINNLTLTSSTRPPLSMFEALGQVFIVTARSVHRINPSTNVVTLSASQGTDTYIQGIKWETDACLVTRSGTDKIITLTALGSPDGWVASIDVVARYFAAGSNRLFRINATGEIKNIITGLDPIVEANWGDSVQMGDTSTLATGLIAYERTVFAGKPEGLYGVGDNGFGVSVIRRIIRETDNIRGIAYFDPWLLVPHVRGLYRYSPGSVETVGLEKELLNDSPIKGRWKAFAVDGDWIYGALAVGSTTYIMVGREKKTGETSFSPIIWDTLLYFNGTCQVLWLSALSTRPRLYFGNGNDVSYIELTDGIGSYEYALTGTRYLNKVKFDDWNPKDFVQIDMAGSNLSVTKYWTLTYSIDGGAFQTLDIDGNVMQLTSTGLHSFYLPITAVGKEIQLAVTYTSNSASSPPELNYIAMFAVPQSQKIHLFSAFLVLDEGIRHGEGTEDRDVLTQLNDLLALAESANSVTMTGPWFSGERNVFVKRPRVAKEVQTGNRTPAKIVEVAFQLRDES